MKFFFLRHTSLDVSQDVFYGQTDLDVSSSFETELKKIKLKLQDENILLDKLKVFSSPLKRCVKLANSLTNKIILDERIMELNLGDWEMKPKQSIESKLIKEWEDNMMTFKIPNGETNQDFLNRLKKFLDQILIVNEDVFIVAHAGSINGMLSLLTGQSFDKLLKNYWEKLSHGSLSLVELIDGSFKILYVGK
jgi:alpha-ribazole phosphatase|tara:strand:- start:2628 stop:3206 length:579 start_codon:yes stop_codon:yes gene_type:complete